MNVLKFVSCCTFGLLIGSVNVNAEGVKMFKDSAPTAEEMGRILFKSPSGGAPKMRSISFGKAASTTLPTPTAESQQSSEAVGLPIKFAYNSADVLDESKGLLDEVGKMMGLPDFSSERLIVEGHTDAAGSEGYNMNLSERRARSVKKYLQRNFGISPQRLQIVGMGESQSLPGVNPWASVNRRVQFRKVP